MLLLSVLLACNGPTEETEDLVPTCPEGSLSEGEVRVFASGFQNDGTRGTEGIVFSPDGRMFVGGAAHGGGGFVAEVSLDGSFEVLTPMVGSVGLEWWNDQLVVAVGPDGFAGLEGGVALVDPDAGTPTLLVDGIAGANFPVVTPWDTLLVSAPGGDSIYEVDAGGTAVEWATDVHSPNGMVFNGDASTLFVAQTYDTPNVFKAIAVSADGVAGAVTELVTLEPGSTQDGVAIDANGDVYVVLNLPGQVVRITPAGQMTVVANGVDFGASLQFGTGQFNECSLYVTSLFTDNLYEVGAGVPAL